MLFKNLEFKHHQGKKVKIIDIPVLGRSDPNFLFVQFRLQIFIASLCEKDQVKGCYSFREHLKKALKWPIYEEIFKSKELKSNA